MLLLGFVVSWHISIFFLHAGHCFLLYLETCCQLANFSPVGSLVVLDLLRVAHFQGTRSCLDLCCLHISISFFMQDISRAGYQWSSDDIDILRLLNDISRYIVIISEILKMQTSVMIISLFDHLNLKFCRPPRLLDTHYYSDQKSISIWYCNQMGTSVFSNNYHDLCFFSYAEMKVTQDEKRGYDID